MTTHVERANSSPAVDLSPANLEPAGVMHAPPDYGYIAPTDPLVLESLERWRDLKFGVIIHWGPYTRIRQGGSWSLHREDLGWFTDQPAEFSGTDAEYHAWYYAQASRLDGRDFDATEWADLCANAGMKYCVFTTKHHDGYCMYDSHLTTLKSTADSSGLKRDILREVTDAFRSRGFSLGAYFSKADWSRGDYWDPALPIRHRGCNYKIDKRPEAWESFTRFTHGQIREILTGYGPFDILWLDAGWVRAPEEPVGIEAISAIAQDVTPGMLIVDRGVFNAFENYRTPEQSIPHDVLLYPWESCMTLTREWCSMSPDDPAKPVVEVITNLVTIVARGGNYLLGFGPDKTGSMVPSVRHALSEIGAWMSVCSEGIYETRPASAPIDTKGEPAFSWVFTEKPARAAGDSTRGTREVYAFGTTGVDDVPATTLRVRGTLLSATVLGGAQVPVAPYTAPDGTPWSALRLPASPTKYAMGVRLTIAAGPSAS